MGGVSRRGFIKTGGAAVAAAGAVAALPKDALAAAPRREARPPAPRAPRAGRSAARGPLIAQVLDARSGEIRLFYGTREVVVTNRRLVSQLYDAAR